MPKTNYWYWTRVTFVFRVETPQVLDILLTSEAAYAARDTAVSAKCAALFEEGMLNVEAMKRPTGVSS